MKVPSWSYLTTDEGYQLNRVKEAFKRLVQFVYCFCPSWLAPLLPDLDPAPSRPKNLGVTLMSKVLSISFIVISAFAVAFAQEPNRDEPPSTGVAPKVINGIGRADVRVHDENGNPIKLAYVKLESNRTDGFFCESWNDTDERGIAALPAIHMGHLKLKIKAKGYQSQELEIPFDQLGEPVRVVLKKK